MSKYPNAGDGLRKLYVSLIGMMVCLLFNIVPVVGFLGNIGVLIFEVIYLIGCFQLGKDIKACKVAFILELASIVLNIVESVVGIDGIPGLLYEMADACLPAVIMALICFPVSKIMKEIGAEGVAKQGVRAWLVYLGCMILSAVFSGTFVLFSFNVIGLGGLALSAIVTLVLSLVGYIFTLKFFKRSAEYLGVY